MGSDTFILIPGAGGRAWYWHLVAARLEQRGHEAVPVALPAADDTAGLPEYADAVIRVIGNREPRRVVLVAQSLAGFIAPLVCKQVPVAALVLLNAMIPKPGERPGEWWTNTRHDEAKREQKRRDGRPADAPFDPLLEFFHDVPQPIIDAAWAQGEPQQRVLIARDDRFFPAEFQRRVARERLGISGDEMRGGHLAALSQPDELTARLVTYATRQHDGAA